MVGYYISTVKRCFKTMVYAGFPSRFPSCLRVRCDKRLHGAVYKYQFLIIEFPILSYKINLDNTC